MSPGEARRADALFPGRGTRFSLYPIPRDVGGQPETVHLPGPFRPGPANRWIRVVSVPEDAKGPYRDEDTFRVRWTPPYAGRCLTPVRPRRGHFDGFRPGTRQFGAVAAFATVECVLRIWEHYARRALRPWFFADRFPVLELIPYIRSGNAWSGDGYLEFGYEDPGANVTPFCDQFDIVAHETGHLILKTLIGSFSEERRTLAFRAHEEASADLVALVSCLHFDRAVDRVLQQTAGQLYSTNALSAIGSRHRYRHLFTDIRFAGQARAQAWVDYDTHAYGRAYSAAVFDVFVEMFERSLRERGAISEDLAEDSRHRAGARPAERRRLRRRFRRAFGQRRGDFRGALLDARDQLGRLLAAAWRRVKVDDFSFSRGAWNLIETDRILFGGRHGAALDAAFRGRAIVPDARARDLPPRGWK